MDIQVQLIQCSIFHPLCHDTCLNLAAALFSSLISDVILVFIMAYQASPPHCYILHLLFHMPPLIFFSWVNSSVYHAALSFSVHFLYHWLSSTSIVLLHPSLSFLIIDYQLHLSQCCILQCKFLSQHNFVIHHVTVSFHFYSRCKGPSIIVLCISSIISFAQVSPHHIY